jgi:uncharacterized protein
VVIFCGLTAYDIQRIKRSTAEALDGEGSEKAAVFGALALFLDFTNLFLILSWILSTSR